MRKYHSNSEQWLNNLNPDAKLGLDITAGNIKKIESSIENLDYFLEIGYLHKQISTLIGIVRKWEDALNKTKESTSLDEISKKLVIAKLEEKIFYTQARIDIARNKEKDLRKQRGESV